MTKIKQYYGQLRESVNNEAIERELLGKDAPERMCEHCETISTSISDVVFHNQLQPTLNGFVIYSLCTKCAHEYIDDAEKHSTMSKVYRKMGGYI